MDSHTVNSAVDPSVAKKSVEEELEDDLVLEQKHALLKERSEQDEKEADAYVDKEEISREAKALGLPIVGGFATGTADITQLLWGREKRQQWHAMMQQLRHFIVASGIWPSLIEGLFAPNLLANMSIMGKIQKQFEESEPCNRRNLAILPSCHLTEQEKKAIMHNAVRYVRYTTAAYGVAMMKGAQAGNVYIPKNGNSEPEDDGNIIKNIVGGVVDRVVGIKDAVGNIIDKVQDVIFFKERRDQRIRRYLGLRGPAPPEEDLIEVENIGTDGKIVGYFIAIEQKENTKFDLPKSVVLAIRGTYNVTDLLTDATGFAVDFCGGYAHKGISESAELLWKKVRQSIVEQLRKHRDHQLMITGHSLGAGVAALLNIMLHYEDTLEKLTTAVGRKPGELKVRCIAIASPPVYSITTTDQSKRNSINRAVENCVAFIHENDCVPFLDGDTVYRLASTLARVDRQTRSMNSLVVKLYAFRKDVTDFSNVREINEIVAEYAGDLPAVPGLADLFIPAGNIFWLTKRDPKNYKPDPKDPKSAYDAALCDPEKLTKLPIYISGPDMITDHLTPQYEKALNSVLSQMQRKKNPFLPKNTN